MNFKTFKFLIVLSTEHYVSQNGGGGKINQREEKGGGPGKVIWIMGAWLPRELDRRKNILVGCIRIKN
jgi:hypothetical protein